MRVYNVSERFLCTTYELVKIDKQDEEVHVHFSLRTGALRKIKQAALPETLPARR
jgi:hypothetical protein